MKKVFMTSLLYPRITPRGNWPLGMATLLATALPLAGWGQNFSATRTDYATGPASFGTAVVDVNGDGRPDLISANAGNSTVSVRLASGAAGGFATTKTDFAAGSGARLIAVVDVNADGRPDLITSDFDDSAVSVRLASGAAGSFSTTRTSYASGSGTYGLSVVDVNGDGRPDLITSNFGSGTASVRLASGAAGSFDATKTDYVSGNSPRSVLAADVNGDGRPDLITTNEGDGTVSVRLASGAAGSFSATKTDYASGSSPRSAVVADVNADGRPDLVTVNNGSNTVSVRLASGAAGSFDATKTDYATGAAPSGVSVVDANVDGRPDLVSANDGGSTASVRLASGAAGSFSATKADFATDGGPTFVTLVDVSADGLLDLITSNYAGSVSVRLNSTPPSDLVISAPGQTIAATTYNSITVLNGGSGTLAGNVTVNSALTVQSGGTLNDGCAIISGPGTFTLAAGGTLGICSPQGIYATGTTGSVQVTGARSFSTDASYVYNGTTPQSTGDALPATVRNLTTTNSSDVSLLNSVSVTQVLTVGGSGNMRVFSSKTLLLPSNASGTALVVNRSTGVVTVLAGSSFTMQRYIGANTAGNGYRHYSSPVQGETLNTLATAGYTPDFTGGANYNGSATPGTTTPFPTVFSYEESRTATAVNNYAPFDKGWRAAEAGTEAMAVGRGYSVNAPGTALVDFTGTPTTGNVTLNNLAYTGADGGWQLLGNPYPAPLDWSTVPATNRPNMNAALYVFQSSGPYTGQYRTYLPALNQGDPLVPAGSGFFVRTAAQGVAGSLTLTNTNRVTTFGPQPVFGRNAADLRPQVQLTLGNAAGTLADDLTVYADPAATIGMDAEYDATKLANSTGLNLSAVAATGAELAIAGLPALTAATVLPLRLQVPATGTYQLAATVANLPAGLTAYLRDLTTGTQTALTSTTTLSLTAGLNTRYALAFASANALAATAGLSAAQVAVFPNPAAQGAGVTVTLPVAAGQQATAEVRDALGRVVVAARALRVSGGQATGELATAGLAPGVYVLRLTAGPTTVSKRLVVE
ncbi:FG-GAP-like repeat-containing protein [Hymenobacter sp. M29]|uniref:FG-GAP-like repeat-containing protein n=1 Tax=Hymenobacter mellowenesis TaxID=3063995 RepID=A0ABT9AHG7_9BACT|nr:FG-GAP-like repeat-containing protein [Hymenobacter sp. M29]MDO7849286.1 FG-GAP-like repeat-containing protein [Hymenobacter sp. M29]